MIIGLKDIAGLFGISIVTCCAVFVCTMFLNYNIDLATVDGTALSAAGKAIYDAQLSMGKITAAVTGGCLGITSVILLSFYIKNYIDAHGKELGILKAIGYSNLSVAKYFRVFGLSVLFGCIAGFCAAYAYLPSFYAAQNADGLLPDIPLRFHFSLLLSLVIVPSAAFTVFSVLYAFLKLKRPALDLIYERKQTKIKNVKANVTFAMMRIMGYDNATCNKTVLGAYRPFACVGFIIGTLYQYGLLKLVVTFVFSNVENMPEYNFDWLNLLITLAAFVVIYEMIMLLFSLRIKKVSLKSVMAE